MPGGQFKIVNGLQIRARWRLIATQCGEPDAIVAETSEQRFHFADAAAAIGFPVALKIRSADIVHKTEAGGVILNLADKQAVLTAADTLVKAARAAYPNAKIDGFTPAQRFYLGYAQVWRSSTRPEAVKLRLKTDPHAPPELRVNGPLSNLPEFMSAFDCPPNSPMVRPANQQAKIW